MKAYTSPFLDTHELKIALRARKGSGAFEKRAPGLYLRQVFLFFAVLRKNFIV